MTFYFRHTLTQGVADSQFTWTGADAAWLPVAGTFSNVEITIDTMLTGDGRAFGPFTATERRLGKAGSALAGRRRTPER